MGDGEGLKMYIHIEGTGTSNNVSTQPSRTTEGEYLGEKLKIAEKCTSTRPSTRPDLYMGRDIARAGNDDLVGPVGESHFTVDQLDLIRNKKINVLFLRCRHHGRERTSHY